MWLPTVQYDDLVLHLSLTDQLRQLGYYRMDAATQVWAMTPWVADVVQAMVAVVARSRKRVVRSMQSGWFCPAYFLWDIGRSFGLSSRLRWLSVAAFASQPLILPLLGSMQAESSLTATTAACVAAVLHIKTGTSRNRSVAADCASVCGVDGVQGNTDTPGRAVGDLDALGRQVGRDLVVVAKLFPVVLLIAGSSIITASLITGNPVLPVFNDVFRSPYFDLARVQ
ncbi:hypothetical protein ACU4GD_15850 [Cupriavidus basilensis]